MINVERTQEGWQRLADEAEEFGWHLVSIEHTTALALDAVISAQRAIQTREQELAKECWAKLVDIDHTTALAMDAGTLMNSRTFQWTDEWRAAVKLLEANK